MDYFYGMLRPFKFKQFTVLHGDSAFKVGTDGVLLGAWVDVDKALHMLDVGCGTGLISLILAQRASHARIVATDINEDAISIAKQNFLNSSWKERLSAIMVDFRSFESNVCFDLIVSNPPYFEDSLKSGNLHKDLARHNDTLPLHQLVRQAAALLSTDGTLAMILPYNALSKCLAIASDAGLYPSRICSVYGKPNPTPKRVMLQLTTSKCTALTTELTVRNADNNYTQAYIKLTHDFYLDLTQPQ